jgi:hypothetical protein
MFVQGNTESALRTGFTRSFHAFQAFLSKGSLPEGAKKRKSADVFLSKKILQLVKSDWIASSLHAIAINRVNICANLHPIFCDARRSCLEDINDVRIKTHQKQV